MRKVLKLRIIGNLCLTRSQLSHHCHQSRTKAGWTPASVSLGIGMVILVNRHEQVKHQVTLYPIMDSQVSLTQICSRRHKVLGKLKQTNLSRNQNVKKIHSIAL